ncbi:CdaR family protein [Pseudoneobacillus sp. C159]
MDKLMDTRWFMKIIALVLALLLYSAVPDGKEKSGQVNVPGEQNTETIEGVPVTSYYDTENLVISGVPNTVDVTVQGPMPNVQAAKALKNFEVYVDLKEIKIGNHTVPIKIKDINNKLKVQIDPAYANINVQERVTKEFRVEAEYDSALLEDGYAAEQPVVEPSKVTITGAKDKIDRITYVKATLELRGKFDKSVTREAKVRVLDKELNKLEVVVEPETVQVTIPVKSTKKTVPIKIVEKGRLPDGYILESIGFIDKDEAMIIGPEDVLDKTDNVRVEVDLEKLTGDTILTLPVIIGNGITKVTPQLVDVKVDVTKVEERTISGLFIKDKGLPEDFEVEYRDPSDAIVNLIVSGPSNKLRNLTENDFNLFLDLSNLTVGLHDVEIQVEGPSDIRWTLSQPVARISITKKEV